MGNKNFQKIISLLIVISLAFVIPYFRFTQVAKAQSVTSYITGISGAITKLPLCTTKTTNKVKGAFSGGSASGLTGTLVDEAGNMGSLTKELSGAISESEDVGVFDKQANEKLDEQKKDIEEIKKSNSAMSENDTCLKSIGRLIIKMLLQKLTMSTVEWINGGYDGTPKFIQDPEQYFKDIGKEEILRFGQEINDPELYPFAKDFMQAQANSFKSKFANNAQYSLDKMIYNSSNGIYNAKTFQQDFSQGGWAAWDAMIQNAANNPLGFSLMASNELARRIEKKTELAEGSLQYGNGFLSVQKCVDPEGVTKEEDDKAINGSAENGPFRKCNKWQIVTPGNMIASAATRTMQNEETSLLKADDLNDAIAALIDAFANSMTSKIQNDGFFDLAKSDEFQYGMEGQFVYNEDSGISYNSPQVEQDFSEFQIAQSTFLSTHPDFNIRTDLTQALIDEQRIFIDKLIEQNKELFSVDPNMKPLKENGYFTGNYGLIPTIYQLDYCIPGPHPGWEDDSRQVLQGTLDTIVPEDTNSLTDREAEEITGMVKEGVALAAAATGAILGATVLSVIPGIGTAIGAVGGAILGFLVGFLADIFDGDNGEELSRIYYNGWLQNITNTPAKTCKEKQNCKPGEKTAAMGAPTLHSKGPFSDAIYTILDRYKDIIYATYPQEKMPTVTKEAEAKFLQLKGYGKIMQDNEEKIASMKSIITRLDTIKKEIDKLNCQIDETCSNYPGTNEKATHITQDEYNKGISQWTSAFSRISATMISGDNIAKVDNLTKQIIDEKDYIYKDLLKGPNGCEKELELGKTGLPWQFYDAKRPNIGLPILYDYNLFKRAEKLPDPFNSGYANKMTDTATNTEKPTFLNGVGFENTNGRGNGTGPDNRWCGDAFKYNPTKIERTSPQPARGAPDGEYILCIHDLFPLRDHSGWVSDRFETVIGIY